MAPDEWGSAFAPIDESGAPIPTDELPLMIAMRERIPAHQRFFIRGLDGVQRRIAVTAFPLVGQGDRYLGAVAMFWELDA